jgi:hypothetical protein
MPDTLPGLLGVQTYAVSLLLPTQGAHIGQRRRAQRSEIIAALPEALQRIEYIGAQGPHKFSAVGRCGTDCLLFMALKFLHGGQSQRDEAWISTAYFVGDASLGRKVRAEQLRQVRHRNV